MTPNKFSLLINKSTNLICQLSRINALKNTYQIQINLKLEYHQLTPNMYIYKYKITNTQIFNSI